MKIFTNTKESAYYKELLSGALSQIIQSESHAVEEIVSNSDIIEIKKNESIQQEGVPAKYLFIILDGLLREHITGEDDESINVIFRTSGESCGATPSIRTGDPAVYSISAISTSIVARCNGKIFYSITEKYPEVMDIIHLGLDNNYTSMYMRLVNLLKKDIPRQLSGKSELSLELIERLPAYHLASYLRITPESLSRIKKKMKEEQEE